jgi:hypothetical protein
MTSADATVIPFNPGSRVRKDRDPRLTRVSRGAYVPGIDADTLAERVRAVAAVVGPGNVVVDRTAAWLHGVDTFALVEQQAIPPMEFCAPPGHARSVRPEVRGRNRTLHPSEIMEIQGVAVTTPIRTAVDLGCHLRRREAMAALDAFARLHDVQGVDLQRMVDNFRRRRGVVQLRELVAYVDGRAESPRESWMRLALIDAGLPKPEPQVWVDVDGEPTYRLDLAYRLARVGVEYDGREAHDGVIQRVRDERRRRHLRELGWRTISIRAGDFEDDRLRRWIGQVREALSETYTTRRW